MLGMADACGVFFTESSVTMGTQVNGTNYFVADVKFFAFVEHVKHRIMNWPLHPRSVSASGPLEIENK